MRAFPPRLPEQPIFYPVLNRHYAVQIARDWNAPSEQSDFSGFVTEFVIDSHYSEQFPVKIVGSSVHQELWVPAERLTEFNREIQGRIRVVDAFFGDGYKGFIPPQFNLSGKTATEQLVCMAGTFDYSMMDFVCEIAANKKAVYLNFPFWLSRDFGPHGVAGTQRDRVIEAIRQVWHPRFPNTQLYGPHSNESIA